MTNQLSLNLNSIFDDVAEISRIANKSIPTKTKKVFGCYFTPKALSEHMVTTLGFKGGKLGDHGAGSGILSALTAIRHLLSNKKSKCEIDAYEIQQSIQQYLFQTYNLVSSFADDLNRGHDFNFLVNGDFLTCADSILTNEFGNLDSAILNPPYFKIGAKSDINNVFHKKIGLRVPNIYMVFVLLSLHSLKNGGELTALIPRSFMSGRYFKSVRRYIRTIASIVSITRFRSRSNLFKDDNVLQENVVIKFKRAKQAPLIRLYTSKEPNQGPESTMDVLATTLLDNKNDIFILPADQAELDAFVRVSSDELTLSDLDIQMCTGKVVENRTTCLNSDDTGAMYIEAKCLDSTFSKFAHKASPRNHGNGLTITPESQKLVIPAQPCVLIKRISSNSDGQRMHVAWINEDMTNGRPLALSITLQYLAGQSKPMSEPVMRRLTDYLRSSDVELAMRCISGTTQISVDDVALIRFPKWIITGKPYPMENQ